MKNWIVLIAFTSACLFVTKAFAQQESSVWVIAHNKDGEKADLSAAEIEIKRDGEHVTVKDVQRMENIHQHYCLLFDTSKSELKKFQLQQKGAAALLSKLVHNGDRGILANLSVAGFILGESNDPQVLAKVIMQMQVGGGTPLYDAIASCATQMAKETLDQDLRTMFLFSDGDDNLSHVTRNATLQLLLKSGIRVFAFSPNRDDEGTHALQFFAQKTGGEVHLFSKEENVDKEIADLSNSFGNIFRITFSTNAIKPDDQLSKLEIKCANKQITILAPESF